MGTSQDGLSHEVLMKYSLTFDSLATSMCFSRGLFAGTFTFELVMKLHWSSLHALFFTNLILNPIKQNLTKYKEQN